MLLGVIYHDTGVLGFQSQFIISAYVYISNMNNEQCKRDPNTKSPFKVVL